MDCHEGSSTDPLPEARNTFLTTLYKARLARAFLLPTEGLSKPLVVLFNVYLTLIDNVLQTGGFESSSRHRS